MPQNLKFTCWSVLIVLCGAAAAADFMPPANWDRAEAARAVAVTDTASAPDQLRRLATAGNSAKLLDLLQSIRARTDWPAPVQDHVVYQFARDLRAMPPHSVAPEVMAFLQSYEAQVLVAQEEHPQVSVPLYNVRAVAAGVKNGWKRSEAAYEGARMLGQDPALLVDTYLAAKDPTIRQGLLDSLAQASPGQLEAVCFLALAVVEQEPASTDLAGHAALRNGDARALEQLVRTGSGPSIPHILRQSTEVLTHDQLGRLMDTAVHEGSIRTASIAIAELSPHLARYPNHAEALMDLLGDPELGSTAALALARQPSATTLRRLQRLAESDDGSLLASRARLALEVNRTRYAREVPE